MTEQASAGSLQRGKTNDDDERTSLTHSGWRTSLGTGVHCITSLEALESALSRGLLEEWRMLVERDPRASLFQAPGWCIPWYRSYGDAYDPFVIAVVESNDLVGFIPMAVHRSTRAFVFASEQMADYRDIVALPDYRLQTVQALVRSYIEGAFDNPLEIGWLDPASDTPTLLSRVVRDFGLRTITRHQPCWRWFPPPPRKPSAQKFLNWYKRHGEVSFDIIRSGAAWSAFKNEYYKQHSLRQIQSGRVTAFDDPRRVAFYDALFESADMRCHVSAFRFNGRMLAGHFGYVWRDVLLLGPPSISLEEEQRSPAVILFAWIIQNAATLGLAGFDLTIGESDFKARLGSECVQLTTVELYGRRRTYFARLGRRKVTERARGIVEAIAGRDAWKKYAKPFASSLAAAPRMAAEFGMPAMLAHGARRMGSVVYDSVITVGYGVTRIDFRRGNSPTPVGVVVEVHDDNVDDMLLLSSGSTRSRSALSTLARSYSRDRVRGRSLHTVLVNGELAGWMYSHRPATDEPLFDGVSDSPMAGTHALVLSSLYRVHGHERHPVYESLISHVVERRLSTDEEVTHVVVSSSDGALRAPLEKLGFRVLATHRSRRLLRWVRSTTTPTNHLV